MHNPQSIHDLPPTFDARAMAMYLKVERLVRLEANLRQLSHEIHTLERDTSPPRKRKKQTEQNPQFIEFSKRLDDLAVQIQSIYESLMPITIFA